MDPTTAVAELQKKLHNQVWVIIGCLALVVLVIILLPTGRFWYGLIIVAVLGIINALRRRGQLKTQIAQLQGQAVGYTGQPGVVQDPAGGAPVWAPGAIPGQPTYPAQGANQGQPGYGVQGGYQGQQPGYVPPGSPAPSAYPAQPPYAQPGYAAQPGYSAPSQAGYPSQPGYPGQGFPSAPTAYPGQAGQTPGYAQPAYPTPGYAQPVDPAQTPPQVPPTSSNQSG